MTRQSALRPRKKPLQRRAVATVEAILDAAARILKAEGYDAATTNHIAEVAGVSIGSLYQYFANREVLFAALKARHTRAVFEVLKSHILGHHASRELKGSITHLIAALEAANEQDSSLHYAFETSLAHIDSSALDGDLEEAFYKETHSLLEMHRSEIARPDLSLATRIVMSMTEAVIHDVILVAGSTEKKRRAEQELVTALVSYLTARGG